MATNNLSLNGGGVRGLIQLQQLQALDSMLEGNLATRFDYMAGTSTGALTIALLAKNYTPADIINIYTEHLPKIFKKKFLRFGLFGRAKYSNTYIIGLAKDLLGENTRLGDLKHNILIPAYNADKDATKFFKSFDEFDKDYLLHEVALASSAAPAYFPAIKVNGEYYKDGGLSYNNPSDLLVQENNAKNEKVINLISFTTGTVKGKTNRAEVTGSITGSVAVSFEDALREQEHKTHMNLSHAYKYYQNGTYVRCESIIKNSSGEIDDASCGNIAAMIEDGVISTAANQKLLRLFCSVLNTF